jgi:hypothetical protein
MFQLNKREVIDLVRPISQGERAGDSFIVPRGQFAIDRLIFFQ